jgi:succinate-semialdehyde dehydrogenase/glutarate-semialdehyde dehydrogenase
MIELTNSSLLKTHAYIDGQWTQADDSATFPVTNPYDGNLLARVADAGRADTDRAITAAHRAFPHWRDRTAADRATLLYRWYELIMQHQQDLARLLTAEQGKPLSESRGEVSYGAGFIQWFAEEAKRVYGDLIPPHRPDVRIIVRKEAVGVAAIITPWNFPIAMITRKVGAALAAGCTVVIKPAEDTPLSALALAQLAEEAGIPAGVVNVVPTSKPEEVGDTLLADSRVKKLSFTGSTAVGKVLMRKSADTLKKLSLELGGNAPFIVFDDADLDAAVEGAIASKYRNGGQTCVCSNRLFVQEGVYPDFAARFTEAVRQLRVGNGQSNTTDIGPLINEAALEKVERLVGDAKNKKARVIVGGHRAEEHPNCYAPTVLLDASPDMQLAQEEIFGPVAPLFKFSNERQVIELANATPYGLAAYFYGQDHARIWRVAEALEYGMVGINTGMISTPVAPFGGVKQSGFGREGSKYGIEEYLTIKYLCWGGLA